MTYKDAKGVLLWKEGDEKPEDAVRRLRDGGAWYEEKQECGHPNRYIYYRGQKDDPNSKECLLCDNIDYEDSWIKSQVELRQAVKWSAAWKKVAKKWFFLCGMTSRWLNCLGRALIANNEEMNKVKILFPKHFKK